MSKNYWNSITDILADVADIFGLGDSIDYLTHPELVIEGKYKDPNQVYQEIVSKINDKIDSVQSLNNDQISRLTNALNAMYSQAPSLAFKDKINDIKNNLSKQITNLSNRNAVLESTRQNAMNNASRVLSERGSGATYMQSDIERQNQEMVDKIQSIENKI